MEVLFNKTSIQNRCGRIVNRIVKDHKLEYPNQPIIMIGVLNGALPFLNDLSRRIDQRNKVEVIIDTLECKSVVGVFKRVKPKITKFPSIDLSHRHIILVEDIIDSGATINHIHDELIKKYKGISITTCTFIHRTCSNSIIPTYVGKEVNDPDAWLLGYGMDDEDGTKRNLNQIYVK